jgi:8-oxo-dGTP pyrophosphatase MutT (NUDIX family)
MPAASILPVAFHKGKLHFLFGKENPLEDSAKGFSDFGGGIEPGESAFEAALREGSEELTGFLGTNAELKSRLSKSGVYTIVHSFSDKSEDTYTVHLFPLDYSDEIVEYFNQNHAFLWSRMNKRLLNRSKLFEKIRIEWFCEDDLTKRLVEYRGFYREIVQTILQHKSRIRAFMSKRKPNKTGRRRSRHHRRSTIRGGR